MKKRLLALFLCLIMMLPTALLTGCAKEEEDDNGGGTIDTEAPRTTKSYVMWVIAEEGMDEEQADAVEAAINKILKSKFKTRLDIKYVSEDEYYEKLEAEIEAMRADQAAKDEIETEPVDEEESETEEETIINENGFLEYKYPAFEEHQVDIFFLSGYSRYKEYIDKGWLCDLNAGSELEVGSNKKLDDYINYQLFTSMKLVDGSLYAIPNNRVIGEYTYMLLRKDLMDKYYYGESDITSITNAEEFLNDVKKYETDYDPIAYDSYRDPTCVYYWSIDDETLKNDPTKFSLIGTTYSASASYKFDKSSKDTATSVTLPFSSLFTNSSYRNQLLKLKYYESYGYYANENSTKDFALSIVKGGAELVDQYSDEYYVKVIDYPRATTEDVFGSMFAVCETEKGRDDVKRLLEVITYLNTNSDFRNLLQYGIENVNYTLNSDGTITRTEKNGYYMDINKTGNVFIAYPEEGMSADAWTYGKTQSADMKIDCTLGFDFLDEAGGDISKINVSAIKKILDESEKIEKELAAITSYEEYEAKITEYSNTYKTTNTKLNLSKYTSASSDGDVVYPVTLYQGWLDANSLIPDIQ